MSHLIQEYAKACGVKIGKPIISPIFYPIVFEKYITIHHGSCPATTYAYLDELIELLKMPLRKGNIKIVQIIDGQDQACPSADQHVSCSKKQALFIIKNALCHVGVDSIYSNFAGENSKPLVMLYSHTNPNNSQPWRINASKTKYLCGVGDGQKPSYDPNENPRTINSIYPEKIAEAILDVIKIKNKIKFETLFIGGRYKETCVDVIPSEPTTAVYPRLNIRMDVHHNEENLQEILSRNIAEVTLSSPIADEILQSRKISIINYIASEFDCEFVKKVKNLGIHINLLCVSPEKLSSQRFKFFEYEVIFHDLQKTIEENAKRFKDLESKKVRTKSNKKIVIGDKEYFSYLDAIKSKELFLLDLDWLYLYTVE